MDYTTTVAAGLLILFGVLFALWLVWKLETLPFRAWRGHRDKQSRARLGGGLEALHHGHYARAQKLLEQAAVDDRSEEHTSEIQSLMRIPYAVFCLKKKT